MTSGQTELASLESMLETARVPIGQLFRRYRVAIQDAEDILQTSVVSLIRHWELVLNPGAYFYETVRRQVVRHVRRRAAEILLPLAEAHRRDPPADDPEAKVHRRLEVQRLLARLSPEVRRVALLHYGAGMTYAEIGVEVGRPEAAVRKLVSRGLQQLVEKLAAREAR